MIFTARYNGEIRGAWNVPFQEDAYCLECGERMRIWREFDDGHARHFRHVSNMGGGDSGGGGGCSGGESPEHTKWKNFAAERLNEVFGDRAAARATVEKTLAAPWSDKEDRSADACVFFENWDRQFGRGLAIEVQHKHKDKDKHAVEMDYNRQDVAVLWLSGDDFHDNGLRMAEVDIRHRTRKQTSICELSDKWTRVVAPDGTPAGTHTEQPTTHAHWIYECHDPRDAESSVPATIVAHWVLPTPQEYWRREGWKAAFRTVDSNYTPTYDRGAATCIRASIPVTVNEKALERMISKYSCRDCRWKGNEYLIVNDGTTGGTAVCPNCAGGLQIT